MTQAVYNEKTSQLDTFIRQCQGQLNLAGDVKYEGDANVVKAITQAGLAKADKTAEEV